MNLVFHTALQLAAPPRTLFDFLGDPRNLEESTPSWFGIRIRPPGPSCLGAGTRIRYDFRLHGLPLPWESEIREWYPPHRFTYVQLRGPYRHFRHLHIFEPLVLGPDRVGTRVVDRIIYHPPGGRLADRLWVRGRLRAIFTHRDEVLRARFGMPDRETIHHPPSS